MRYYLSPVSKDDGSDVNKAKEKAGVKDITECKCEVCKKRNATTVAVRPFESNPIPVCEKCYQDILDEEND